MSTNKSLPALQFTCKNFEMTDAIKEAVEAKFVHHFQRYAGKIVRIHVMLEVEKLSHNAKATIRSAGQEIYAHASSKNLYDSLDLLIDKLLAQLRKQHDKQADHH